MFINPTKTHEILDKNAAKALANPYVLRKQLRFIHDYCIWF